ncbi:MAG: MMPL family transporter [Paludibacteraceae bacterium]
MREWLLRIYDFFLSHRAWLWTGLAALIVPLVILAFTLRYDEDIMDFLPVSENEREALDEYRTQQSAARFILVIEGGSEEQRYDALDEIAGRIAEFGYELNEPDINEQIDELYANMPYLIADSVYDRFDSVFTPQAIHEALLRDKQILATPGTGAFSAAIRHDPLQLVQPSTLRSKQSSDRTYAFCTSPYGATETQHNAALLDSLNNILSTIHHSSTHWTGSPVIAVGNARRIKMDTLMCISLSLVLIIILLAYAFPCKRDLWLILLAVSFGWLFGMAVLRIVTPLVSAVVLGIGSVLIGIAVNYPLHLLVHQRYTSSIRQTLDEVLSPLVVGNITTVGAFMALIPLEATALKHLGIFAAAMLGGTIVFCVFVMPHLMSAEPTPVREIKLPHSIIPSIHNSSIHQSIIFFLTILVGIYLLVFNIQHPTASLFDSNLSHINYMTPQQREDMAALDITKGDATRWEHYWQTHDADSLVACVQREAEALGFRSGSFDPFFEHIHQSSITNHKSSFNFSSIAQRLSDDFDYIGLVCSIIVFVFLWLSFRNLWLALIAFVPMLLSWVWIFAIMQLCGLQFNIVNIILATFIFGQGDDYTIFIVEGLLYEHRTGKTILPQFRQSIILSSLIMLIGIGILVIAVHPAMHSLGAITLIGMTVVLIMATTIPPLLFRIYTHFNKNI